MAVVWPTLVLERHLWQQGLVVAGVDEVGRGCLAGPVVAGAVIVPPGSYLERSEVANDYVDGVALPAWLRDSKTVPLARRIEVATALKERGVRWAVGQVSAAEIDQMGIVAATYSAMTKAVEGLGVAVGHYIVDGVPHPSLAPQTAQAKADATVASVSAAAMIAKVYRDELMTGLAQEYAQYGWQDNMGYGTAAHTAAIVAHGLSPYHRRSFCRAFVSAIDRSE